MQAQMDEGCLNDDTVMDFVAGRLTEAARAEVERHVGDCTLCSQLIAVAAGYLLLPPANDAGLTPITEPAGGVRPGALPPGTILRETYRIERLIGRGGMGEVFEAAHARLPGRYAVKVLHQYCAGDPKAIVRFRREAEITSGLRHPNIVTIVDFDYTPAGAAYLVMEYLDGPELARVIGNEAPLALDRVLRIVDQIASALDAVHRRNIVHRDLKPQNIFLLPEEGTDGERVKLVDFGISKVRAASVVLTGERVLLGTPQYMAPEQAQGMAEVDARADQFALAAITYEMLTGRLAFPGDRVEVVVYRISNEEPPPLGLPWGPAIGAVVSRALSKDPGRRYPSIHEFASSLRAAAEADGPVAQVAAPARAPGRPDSRETPAPTTLVASAPKARRALLGTLAGLGLAALIAVPVLRRAQSRARTAPAAPAAAAAAAALPAPAAAPGPSAREAPGGAADAAAVPAAAAAPAPAAHADRAESAPSPPRPPGPAAAAGARAPARGVARGRGARVVAPALAEPAATGSPPQPPPAPPVRGSKLGSLIDKL